LGSARNRRKKITNVLTSINSRIRNVELRSTSQDAEAGNNEETDENFVTPGSYLSTIAPSTWKKVIAGYYYSKQVTGLANDRVELFLNVDAGLERDEYLEVSGIRSPVNVSKKRKVLGTGQVVGEYRTDKPWYSAIPAGATHALLYSVGAEPGFSQSRILKTKFPISSFSATVEVATIVFSEVHTFAIGDVIDVSELGGNIAGIDGLFRVDTVPSTTSITYKFSKSLQFPIASTPATPNKFVYATVHEYVELGDSWINTATNPDSLFIWDGLRWIAASDPSSVKKDDLAPKPPTNLQVATVAYPNETGFSRASATFSWTAPTQNVDDSELTDLAGYDIEWAGPTVTGVAGDRWATAGGYAFVENSINISDLPAGQEVQFRVRTIDTGGLKSTYATITKLMGTRSDVLSAPSAPIATTRLGTVTVRWDGLQANGSVPPLFLDYLEVHVGTTSNFTPSANTLQGKIDKTGNDFFVITNLDYNAVRFIRLVSVDQDGKKSPPSTQVQITVKPLVDTDIIGQILNGAKLVPGSVTASESIIGNTITGNLIQALTIRTGNLEANIITADKINAGAITAVAIRANAITTEKINAGAVTADTIAANAITAAKIVANAITAVKISANAITADKIAANAITAVKISAGAIDSSKITAVGIIGRNIATAPVGQRRISMRSDPENRIDFFSGAGSNPAGQIGTIAGDIVLNRFSGLNGGGIIVGSFGLSLTSGEQSPVFCGAATYVDILNSSRQVRIGSNFAGSTSGLVLNFSQKQFFGSPRYMWINENGEVNYTSNFAGILSDIRLKNLIPDEPLGINLISKLNPVSFKWKPETGMSDLEARQSGLIAQEVEVALSELGFSEEENIIVNRLGNDYYVDKVGTEEDSTQMRSINYDGLVPVLIKSTQELLARIETLESEIATLKEGKTNGS
jgi:hypothetical protein